MGRQRLQSPETWQHFRDDFSEWFEASSQVQLGLHAGQAWAFAIEMMAGDIVCVPDTSNDRVGIYEVIGNYEFLTDIQDECPYPHRRGVKWIHEVRRSEISEPLRSSLNTQLTIFRLGRHKDEIEVLAGIREPSDEEEVLAGDEMLIAIVERFFHMSATEFEDFVADLLRCQGFQAVRTQATGDGGVDVIGSLDALELAEVNLHVQVKRRRGRAGIEEILQLRGTLGPEDQGVFVSVGGFTKQAEQEAEAQNRRPIRLVSGSALALVVLKYYGDLGDSHRAFFALESKPIPLVDQFLLRRRRA